MNVIKELNHLRKGSVINFRFDDLVEAAAASSPTAWDFVGTADIERHLDKVCEDRNLKYYYDHILRIWTVYRENEVIGGIVRVFHRKTELGRAYFRPAAFPESHTGEGIMEARYNSVTKDWEFYET